MIGAAEWTIGWLEIHDTSAHESRVEGCVANLKAVESRALDVPTVFIDFNDYWSPFLRGQGPAGSYCVSLSEDDRECLREHLENIVPVSSDGTIHLIARAWGVRGTIPV